MTDVRPATPRWAEGAAPSLRLVPAALLVAAVMFNPALAVVNAHVMPLTQASVVAAEMMLVAAALVVAVANYRPRMMVWFALIGVVFLLALFRSIALEQVQVKYLRDVLLIPTFILLGMTFDRHRLTRTVVIIHAIVLAFLVLEAVNTSAYSQLFRIQDYYINTRGYDIADFWNKQSDLYVSAMRPDSRMFDFLELHRLSSIFLEPVSLGSYCIIVVAFVCAQFERLNGATRAFLIGGAVLALVGCDGRLAAGASVIIVAATIAAPYLPRYSAVLYLPGVLLVATLLVLGANLHAGSDDVPGRVAHSVELLQKFEVRELLGLSDERMLLSQAVDSGIAYLVMTQSLIGVIILWMFIIFGSAERTWEQVRFTHATAIYLSLTMIVSFGFLTIKTAALLWFIYGALQAPDRAAGATRRSAWRAGASPVLGIRWSLAR